MNTTRKTLVLRTETIRTLGIGQLARALGGGDMVPLAKAADSGDIDKCLVGGTTLPAPFIKTK